MQTMTTGITDTPGQFRIRSSEDLVRIYGLSLLEASPGDWSIVDGDLAMTRDGDPQEGSRYYNALFRLVNLWRYNEPHLRYLFGAVSDMMTWRASLAEKLNQIGDPQNLSASMSSSNPWEGFPEFAEAIRATSDQQALAHFGANTYAGCLLIVLSNALRRFRDDIDPEQAWKIASPSFNGFSVGQIIVAGANGYRHEDDWAKATVLDDQQKRSHDVITGALAGRPASDEPTPARYVELIQLLSDGDFEVFAKNVLGFAHDVAVMEETRP